MRDDNFLEVTAVYPVRTFVCRPCPGRVTEKTQGACAYMLNHDYFALACPLRLKSLSWLCICRKDINGGIRSDYSTTSIRTKS